MTDLTPGNIHLWLAAEPAVLDPSLAARYAAMLNAEEQVRWQRFIHARDRDRFLLARALVRTVLAQYLDDAAPATLDFSTGIHGKPALAAPGSSINFNLSHTKGLVALAVTATGEIGVDVEAVTRRVALLELATRYFSPAENQQLLALPEAEQRERFFRLWTLKEAYVKACGLGLRIPLDSFSFDFAEGVPVISFADTKVSNGGDWFFQSMEHAEDFRIGLALKLNKPNELKVTCYVGMPVQGFTNLSV